MPKSPLRNALARLTSEGYPFLRGTGFQSQFRHLKRLEYVDQTQLRTWQKERLTERLTFWTQHIPFYRNHIALRAEQLGRKPSSLFEEMVETLTLHHLPYMKKADIMSAGALLEVDNHPTKQKRRNHTGGSTGEVFHFLQNAEDSKWMFAGLKLFRSFVGLNTGSRLGQIWGSPIGLSKAKNLRARIGRFCNHSQFHSTYDLTAQKRIKIVQALQKFDPELIIGYPSSLTAFLPEIDQLKNRSFKSLKAVWTASETLLPSHREDLERVFKCPVFNNYGCREFGPLAMECEAHEGLHLNEGAYLFEFIPVAEDLHEIVITDLKNNIMPLIRYRIGDLAKGTPQLCSCGRSYHVLKGIEGRTFDLIRGINGETITGTFWTLLLRSNPGVKRFQVVQNDWQDFIIRLETTDEFSSSSISIWEARIQEQFKQAVTIDWQIDHKIQQLPSGKFRFIQSNVTQKSTDPQLDES